MKSEIEAKIEYREIIADTNSGGYQPVRFPLCRIGGIASCYFKRAGTKPVGCQEPISPALDGYWVPACLNLVPILPRTPMHQV